MVGCLLFNYMHALWGEVTLPRKVLELVLLIVIRRPKTGRRFERVHVQDRYPTNGNLLYPSLEPSLWCEKSSACEAVRVEPVLEHSSSLPAKFLEPRDPD